MSDLEIQRAEYGDVIVSKSEGGMTVAELIEALGHMPPGATVRRYAEDWEVESIRYEHPSNFVDLR